MRGLESIANSLFEKIRSRFPSITMGDENGAPTSESKDARFFDFDYVVEGENHGAVSISIKEPESLKIYYSQNMLENIPEPIETGWYNFLKEMRFFAKKHMMGFDTRDIAKSNLDKRDYKYLSNNNTVQESAMYGTSKSSYEELDKTKLIIRHKKEITPEQAGARTRNISSLFIENSDGERFKYPYAHLAGARAMARHVANGGLPHDDFGKHIIETSSNIAKLTAFKRYVGKKDFMNTTSNDIIEGSNVELENLRNHIKKLQGQQYYVQTKENFAPVENGDTELGEDVINELTNAFTIPQFNEELKDMFPLLHSIHQKRVAETTLDLDSVVGEASAVAEMDLDSFFTKVAGADSDGFDMLHDAMMGKYGKAVEKEVQDMYNDISADHGLHPDDDFERIYDRMLDNIEDDYGKTEGLDDFESWADDVVNNALEDGNDDNGTTDVTIDKDGAMKLAGDEEEPKDEKASTEDIIEFVRSFYDKETGAFPKGETGVVISARKRFGDSVGDLVEKFVSKLTGKRVELADDDSEVETNEYHDRDNKGFSDKEIKMAFGVLNDKRFKGGNYTGAVEVIEKIAKGLSKHPSVANALKRTNEDLEYIKSKLAKLIK